MPRWASLYSSSRAPCSRRASRRRARVRTAAGSLGSAGLRGIAPAAAAANRPESLLFLVGLDGDAGAAGRHQLGAQGLFDLVRHFRVLLEEGAGVVLAL